MITDSNVRLYSISLVFLTFPRTVVRSYGISLLWTFLHIIVRSHLLYYCCHINGSWFVSSFIQYQSYLLKVSPHVSSFLQYQSYLLNVSPSLVHLYSLDQSYLLNISRNVNSFVQHQYSQKLFSFISSFVQLLYQSYHSSQRFSVRYFVFTVLVLSSQRFSVRQLVCAVLVLSSQRFSVRQFVCTVISLISTFLRALDRLYSLGT